MSKFCLVCSQPYHPVFHEHIETQDTTLVTIADFMMVEHPPVAPRERKPRENPKTFGGLTVGRECHKTIGGRGIVGRLK